MDRILNFKMFKAGKNLKGRQNIGLLQDGAAAAH